VAFTASGRHILAQFDDEAVVVYQAYRPEIGHFAARNGYFGGAFSLGRMSWIKPNFLWMMFRSGWGTKESQEVTLAVWLQRSAFDAILREAVHSTFVPEVYASQDEWKQAVPRSSVRVQWDPDHDPSGGKAERRAVQLGLRGNALRGMPASGSSASRTSPRSLSSSALTHAPQLMTVSWSLGRGFTRWRAVKSRLDSALPFGMNRRWGELVISLPFFGFGAAPGNTGAKKVSCSQATGTGPVADFRR